MTSAAPTPADVPKQGSRKLATLVLAVLVLGGIFLLPLPDPLQRGGNLIELTSNGKTCLAILAFAVSVETEGFNLNTIGIILMIVGGIGALLTLVALSVPRREERTEYVKQDVDLDSRDR